MPTLSKRSILIVLTSLLLLLVILSMRMMQTSSFWYDEIVGIKCAGGAQYGPGTLTDIFNCVRASEANAPGFHIILRLWGTLVGWSEFALWMLSLLVGLVAVASMYRLGHDLFVGMGEHSAQVIGLSAAIVLGMSAFFIQFLYELRVYVFIVLATIWFIWLYWRIRQQSNPSIIVQAAFVLSVAALLYFHYMTVCVLGAVALYHLVIVKKDRRWWRVPLLMLAGGLLFLPWVSSLSRTADLVQNFATLFRRPPDQMAQMLAYTFSNSNVALLALLGIFALLAFVVAPRITTFVWSIFIISLLIGLLLIVFVPLINRPRYLLYLWPMAALLTALGIEQLRRRGVNPAFILVIWAAAGLWNYFNPSAENMDHNLRLPWLTFRSDLQQYAQPGDVVLFHTPISELFEALEFSYYTHGLPVRGSLTEDIPGAVDNDEYFKQVSKFIGDAPRLWLGVEQASPPNFRLGQVERILNADYVSCYKPLDIPWYMRLELYARTDSKPILRFGNPANQVDIALLSALKVDAAKSLNVLLTFAHPATLPLDTYSVSLHVEDSQGRLKAQSDFGLADDAESCHLSGISLKDLPPGQYTLRAIVYEWRSGQRLPGQVLATGTSDDQPIVGVIDVK